MPASPIPIITPHDVAPYGCVFVPIVQPDQNHDEIKVVIAASGNDRSGLSQVFGPAEAGTTPENVIGKNSWHAFSRLGSGGDCCNAPAISSSKLHVSPARYLASFGSGYFDAPTRSTSLPRVVRSTATCAAEVA